MIHHHSIGDAKITGVIEYSGPTHAPEFLYPAVDKTERHAVLKANASWLAPNHYAPNIDRLIVTVQLWVVRAGGNVIIVDTGVGNRKSRTAAARMDQLNTLVMPWLDSIGAGPEQVTHVVMTHLHTDHVGWNTVEKDGAWVPTFPKARYLIPQAEFDYWKAQYDRGDKAVNQGSFLHHFVANAEWSDKAVLVVVRAHVLPVLERQGPIRAWLVGDTTSWDPDERHAFCGRGTKITASSTRGMFLPYRSGDPP